MWSQLRTLWSVFSHLFQRRETVSYPEEMPWLAPRYRGRIVLTRDPDGEERCVACNLCAVACPVDCIALQKTETEDGRWLPEFFRINMSPLHPLRHAARRHAPPTPSSSRRTSRCPSTTATNMVYEKEHLLIDGPGKYHDYSFWQVAGKAIAAKEKGEAEREQPPGDVHDLMP
ncbi:MAG: NADH-quinone oxidoreductase subunit NuoI [Gammaproteobacteria bacterium]|nr:NADH-quinone oxidoreductase subunit NuoI [Gammaproteobacteria bacterium]